MRMPGTWAPSALAAMIACVGADALHAQTPSPGSPQAYPVKPVRMVVPFAPGGGTDVIARYLAAGMTESINRQVVVDNRARRERHHRHRDRRARAGRRLHAALRVEPALGESEPLSEAALRHAARFRAGIDGRDCRRTSWWSIRRCRRAT